MDNFTLNQFIDILKANSKMTAKALNLVLTKELTHLDLADTFVRSGLLLNAVMEY